MHLSFSGILCEEANGRNARHLGNFYRTFYKFDTVLQMN